MGAVPVAASSATAVADTGTGEGPISADVLAVFAINEKIHCTDNWVSDAGKSECTLTFDVEVNAPQRYEGKVAVRCDADFALKYLNDYYPVPRSESTAGMVSMRKGQGRTSMKIVVRPWRSIDKVYSASVKKLSCQGRPV